MGQHTGNSDRGLWEGSPRVSAGPSRQPGEHRARAAAAWVVFAAADKDAYEDRQLENTPAGAVQGKLWTMAGPPPAFGKTPTRAPGVSAAGGLCLAASAF